MRKNKIIKYILGNKKSEINPDEIFLDSSNLPDFDKAQFEGRIEKPFSKYVPILVFVFFIAVSLIYTYKAWDLQILNGDELAERSSQNRLNYTALFSERGSVLDRNGVVLATNIPGGEDSEFSLRKYTEIPGLSHILGYIRYPQKDSNGYYYQTEFEGLDGVEKTYNDYLTGKNGLRIVESDAVGRIATESVIEQPVNGKNLKLSIDSRVQSQLYKYIEELAGKVGFSGGAGAIMDVTNGKLLSLVSYPEYDSQVLTDGVDTKKISSYNTDNRNVYINRVISGLYAPGSVMKLFVAMGVLNEKVIDPLKKILSTGSITVPNPYFPDKGTTFKDWKPLGWVDMRGALAMSSNIYFFHVGGGFDGQEGIGIDNINKYVRMFGFGSDTGIQLPNEVAGSVPNPEWKKENFNGEDWRLGDTFLTAIGQYGFQATLLQLLRGTSAIVSNGKLYKPLINEDEKTEFTQLEFDDSYYQIVREGMYQAVYGGGTAHNLNSLPVKVGAKTGTAELGYSKERVNSWVTGFYPYDNPKYAFSIMLEKGPRDNAIGGLYVASEIINWMSQNTPEYMQ